MQRRTFLGIGAALTATPVLAQGTINAELAGVKPNLKADQTAALQKAIDLAANARSPLSLTAGDYRCGALTLKPNTHIQGVRGATRLIVSGMISGNNAENLTLSSLILDATDAKLPANAALINAQGCENLRLTDCTISNVAGNGVSLRNCSGQISGSTITNIKDAALFGMDSTGLIIAANTIRNCEDNGILIWTSIQKPDGTIVTGNSISKIGNRSGGSGQWGNGINVFRAGNVIVSDNRIDDCTYSAVRGNASNEIHIANNNCTNLGEVAIYAEFGFQGAIISNNSIRKCATGISVTNFNEGGRLAIISNNIVQEVFLRGDPETDTEARGIAIFAEADTLVTENVVEGAPLAGIALGWGNHMRDVSATNNIIRNCFQGVTVSVSSGAGAALIVNNLISGSKSGAIIGKDELKTITGDLSASGSEPYPQLAIRNNLVR